MICQEMGWSYFQFMNQPEWFIDLLLNKLEIDAKNARREIRKIKQK